MCTQECAAVYVPPLAIVMGSIEVFRFAWRCCVQGYCTPVFQATTMEKNHYTMSLGAKEGLWRRYTRRGTVLPSSLAATIELSVMLLPSSEKRLSAAACPRATPFPCLRQPH